MTCDLCGCEIHGQPVLDTHYTEWRGKIKRKLTMCPDCAADRAKTYRAFYWMLPIVFGAVILILLLLR